MTEPESAPGVERPAIPVQVMCSACQKHMEQVPTNRRSGPVLTFPKSSFVSEERENVPSEYGDVICSCGNVMTVIILIWEEASDV